MNKRILGISIIALASVAVLAGCRSNSGGDSSGKAKTDLRVAIVTDTGGISDRSFNQSSWESLQEWGKENNLKKGQGYNYFQSNSASEFTTNFNSAQSAGYKLVFGVGFSLLNATKTASESNPDTNYVIMDSVINGKKNVASATFADNESAYLAGVAAAKASKTGKIGFIGGMESDVINRFKVGYEAGAKSVNPNIKVDAQYAGSFQDASKGKTIAHAMYGSGDDVIYQCAGGVGTGAFNEAKSLNEASQDGKKVWIVGVDQDQKYLGNYKTKDGKDDNYVLVSTIKKVGTVVKDVSTKTSEGKFPGGKVLVYNLKNAGVDLALDNVTPEIKDAVVKAKEEVISGKVTVPEK